MFSVTLAMVYCEPHTWRWEHFLKHFLPGSLSLLSSASWGTVAFREGQVCGLKTGVHFGDSCEFAVLIGALHSPGGCRTGGSAHFWKLLPG